jgi:hypothetical protein
VSRTYAPKVRAGPLRAPSRGRTEVRLRERNRNRRDIGGNGVRRPQDRRSEGEGESERRDRQREPHPRAAVDPALADEGADELGARGVHGARTNEMPYTPVSEAIWITLSISACE